MYHKHHFFTLLSACFIFGAFILDYFDKSYVKFLLGLLGIGILLDFVWLLVMAGVTFLIDLGLLGSKSGNSTLYSSYRLLEIHCVYGLCRHRAETFDRRLNFEIPRYWVAY
jgi:hypothetical protein